MSRPRAVVYKNIPQYNLLHTQKIKMYCGVEMTSLHLMKETDKCFVSSEVWAYCSHKVRAKKPFTLSVNIPILTDQKTIDFLEEHCWADWVSRERKDGETDMKEAIEYLNRVFPDKEKVYFYELDSLLGSYNHGSFIKVGSDRDISTQRYYNHKYNKHSDNEEVKAKRLRWTQEKDEVLSKQYLDEYHDFEEEWAWNNNNLLDIFNKIGEHAVVFPVAFAKSTAGWYKEKYGKTCGYAHAGEIFFVDTPNKVYFEIKRHF